MCGVTRSTLVLIGPSFSCTPRVSVVLDMSRVLGRCCQAPLDGTDHGGSAGVLPGKPRYPGTKTHPMRCRTPSALMTIEYRGFA